MGRTSDDSYFLKEDLHENETVTVLGKILLFINISTSGISTSESQLR